MRLRRFSPRTQDAYLNWMRRYYEFHARAAIPQTSVPST
jgi:hypothetical protein